MSDNTVFQFEQAMSRDDVAEYLREVADKLKNEGSFRVAAGRQSADIPVAERLQFEIEVEREPNDQGGAEMEVEFELEWTEDEDGVRTGSLSIE